MLKNNSLIYKEQPEYLKVGGYLIFQNRLQRILEIQKFAENEWNIYKVEWFSILFENVSTKEKQQIKRYSQENLDVPQINTKEYQLIDINNLGFLVLLDDKGNTEENVKIESDEIIQELKTLIRDQQQIMIEVKCIFDQKIYQSYKIIEK